MYPNEEREEDGGNITIPDSFPDLDDEEKGGGTEGPSLASTAVSVMTAEHSQPIPAQEPPLQSADSQNSNGRTGHNPTKQQPTSLRVPEARQRYQFLRRNRKQRRPTIELKHNNPTRAGKDEEEGGTPFRPTRGGSEEKQDAGRPGLRRKETSAATTTPVVPLAGAFPQTGPAPNSSSSAPLSPASATPEEEETVEYLAVATQEEETGDYLAVATLVTDTSDDAAPTKQQVAIYKRCLFKISFIQGCFLAGLAAVAAVLSMKMMGGDSGAPNHPTPVPTIGPTTVPTTVPTTQSPILGQTTHHPAAPESSAVVEAFGRTWGTNTTIN